jgi:hypothetical protein
MADIEFKTHRVLTRTDIPALPAAGTLYFVSDENVILLRLLNGTYEEYAAGGGGSAGNQVVDSLVGNQTDKAPSVHIIKAALLEKADLDSGTGKLIMSQMPNLNLMYRGAFTGADAAAAEAALNAAHPTDDLGAYASLIIAGDPNLYVWTGTAWVNTGVSGVWVESINGITGPIVILSAADVGAAPASHVTDTTVHVTSAEKTLIDGLPSALSGKEDKSGKGIANGYAGLDASGKVPAGSLPANLEMTTNKGVANGYAGLDASGKVPEANLPDIDGGGV